MVSVDFFCFDLSLDSFGKNAWMSISSYPSALSAGEIAAHIHQARGSYIKYTSLKDAWEDYQKQTGKHSVHWHAGDKIKHFIFRKRIFRILSGDKIRIVGQVYMLFICDNIYWTQKDSQPKNMMPVYIQVENMLPLNVAEGHLVLKEVKMCGAEETPKEQHTPIRQTKNPKEEPNET